MKWIQKLNKDGMHCFIRCTDLGMNTASYQTQLYTQFLQLHPEFIGHIIKQNVVDRKQGIISHLLLSSQQTGDIKKKIN